MSGKKNLIIEIECAQNWLENYRVRNISGHKRQAMRAHLRELRRQLAGKQNV